MKVAKVMVETGKEVEGSVRKEKKGGEGFDFRDGGTVLQPRA